MIGKLICWGETRNEARRRMYQALKEYVILGVKTTIPLQKRLLNNRDVRTLNFDNHWLEGYLKKEAKKEFFEESLQNIVDLTCKSEDTLYDMFKTISPEIDDIYEERYDKKIFKYKDELSDLADPWVILCLHMMMF